MANQITIDIVAETKKLTSGIDEANKELGGMSKSLKTATKAAVGLASAFVLKQGVSFLKDGIEEAKDARKAMNDATTAFGAGSKALEKITSDAEKFGKALAVDNDDIIKLSTSLGSRLPKDAKELSAELVNLAFDVEAFTAGAVSADAVTGKLAKAFADGEISAKELAKIVPGLSKSVYDQAEALSKAGKNQEALNLVIKAGAAEYGDAAEKNVTASQKFNVALANLKEEIGTKFLPILEKGVDFLVKLLDAFDSLPGPVQNVVIGLTAIVGIGGPLLAFLASAKTSLITLGIVSEGAALGTTLLSTALKAIPVLAVIALLVLLIQNWDDVSKAAKNLWENIKEWFGKIYDSVKEFIGKAIDWLKENWPLILGVLTGPFGLFAAFLIKYKDEVINKVKNIWDGIKDFLGKAKPFIVDALLGPFDEFATWLLGHKDEVTETLTNMWTGIKDKIGDLVELLKINVGLKFLEMFTDVTDWVSKIVVGVVTKFIELRDKAIDAFNKLKDGASKIWDLIRDFIQDSVDKIKNKFGEVYGKMVEVGKDIARGIGAGLTSMSGWFRGLLGDWIERNIPGWAKTILKIQSPSKVMTGIGVNITKGLINGITSSASAVSVPRLSSSGYSSGTAVINNITINAGTGTDPYSVGRAVTSAIDKYSRISSATGQRVTL